MHAHLPRDNYDLIRYSPEMTLSFSDKRVSYFLSWRKVKFEHLKNSKSSRFSSQSHPHSSILKPGTGLFNSPHHAYSSILSPGNRSLIQIQKLFWGTLVNVTIISWTVISETLLKCCGKKIDVFIPCDEWMVSWCKSTIFFIEHIKFIRCAQ